MAEVSTPKHSHLLRGGLLARNVLWSFLSSGLPLIVAIPVMPVLIRSIGTDRFGVLTLAWAVTGYAGLLDLGLGRALTQVVARKLGDGEEHRVPDLVWTSLLLMMAFGVLGTALIMLLSPWASHHAFRIPQSLQAETTRAFYLVGLSVPAVIASAGFRGLLEAHQRFDLVSILRICTGVFTYIGPLLVLFFSHRLEGVVGVLVLGRCIGCVVHCWFCLRVVPQLRHGVMWDRSSAGSLLRLGGWMTVTNIVGPLMVNLDRFVIAALLSVTAVTYYVTPYEMVTKFLLFPAAIVGVAFPAFASCYSNDENRATMLYSRSLKYVFLMLFPIVLLTVTLASTGLRIWLGGDFAEHSTRVVQWLALGVLANSLGLVPVSFVQGVGRPDVTAKLHLVELPLYLAILFFLIRVGGIEGAAIAWTGRTIVDSVVLSFIARRFLKTRTLITAKTKMLLATSAVTLILAVSPFDFFPRLAFLFVAIVGFVFVTWFLILTPEERLFAQRLTIIYR